MRTGLVTRFLTLIIAAQSFALGSLAKSARSDHSESPYKLGDIYTLSVERNEAPYFSSLATTNLIRIHRNANPFLVVFQKHTPQSIQSVKVRMQELSVPVKELKIKKLKTGTLFYFPSQSGLFVFSTRGGMLRFQFGSNQGWTAENTLKRVGLL